MPYKRPIRSDTDDDSPTKHVYYLNRKVPGTGPEPVHKTLETSRKRVAQRREEAVLGLAERGEFEIVRAWLNDRLSIATIEREESRGRTDQLHRLLNRPDCSLADAIDEAMEVKRPR